ncbi:replication initiator protein A [Fructobacillus tropaeoli]|uniref:replication initiator protein A n=1 Tax=Fructobacillus tropaeoli TaxID=709323 RepID=UPI002D864738|nr:hypothetical protein LMG30238_FMBOGHMB_00871 [Fructobacillus tropaeoli]
MQRISIQQVQAFEQFYRLPKSFFNSEKYKDMKLESKVAYAILRDRFELSVRNGWVDDNQDVYFVYTVNSLCELLNCGNKKVIALKKDLAKYGLLEEVRQGLSKPNRLYLGLAIDENDEKNSLEPLVQAEVSKRHPNDTEYSDTEFSDDNDDVINNTRANDLDLLVDHYQKETGQRPNLRQASRLEQLANLYGPLLVSEAITRSAENNTSNLLYIEKVAQSMNEVQQEQFRQLRQSNEPIIPITKLSDMDGGLI